MNVKRVEYIHSLENSARYATIIYRGLKVEEETIGELLNRLLTQKGMSQRKLATLSGVDRGYINSLVKGKAGSITLRIAKQFASALNVPPEIFLKSERSFTQETPEEILERLKVVISSTVPIYEDFPFHAGEPVEPMNYVPIVKDRAKGRNLEGYIVHGNCLHPEIQDGDVIIVDRDGQIDSGNIVACLFEDMLHLGRLKKITNEIYLENNDGRIKFECCQAAAPVIEVRRRLK